MYTRPPNGPGAKTKFSPSESSCFSSWTACSDTVPRTDVSSTGSKTGAPELQNVLFPKVQSNGGFEELRTF